MGTVRKGTVDGKKGGDVEDVVEAVLLNKPAEHDMKFTVISNHLDANQNSNSRDPSLMRLIISRPNLSKEIVLDSFSFVCTLIKEKCQSSEKFKNRINDIIFKGVTYDSDGSVTFRDELNDDSSRKFQRLICPLNSLNAQNLSNTYYPFLEVCVNDEIVSTVSFAVLLRITTGRIPHYRPGLCTILGRAGSGKSTLLEGLFDRKEVIFKISSDEPCLYSRVGLNMAGLDRALMGGLNVVVIDSLKGLTYDNRFGYMSGGLSGAVAAVTTWINNVMLHYGIRCIAAFNPVISGGKSDDFVMQNVREILTSNTSDVLCLDSSTWSSRSGPSRILSKRINDKSLIKQLVRGDVEDANEVDYSGPFDVSCSIETDLNDHVEQHLDPQSWSIFLLKKKIN